MLDIEKNMNIISTHHIDASDVNADGSYDYYYEYDIYEISDKNTKLMARSYIDEPEKVHFLSIQENKSKKRLLNKKDLKSLLIKEAIKYFVSNGKYMISYLSNTNRGYLPINVNKKIK